MSMVTTCPHCQTTFRITTEHLNARQGEVRCGRCGELFNAFDTLATRGEEHAKKREREVPEQPLVARPAESVDDSGPISVIEIEPLEPLEEGIPYDFEPLEAPSELKLAEETGSEPEPELEREPALEPERVLPDREKRHWPTLLSLAGSLLLLALLAGQTAYFFRTELAANTPWMRPYLEQACAVLNCRIALPRNADLISIESSELQADPTRATVIVLNAVVRNRAKFPQQYPSLELTLTNAQDQAIARRIFSPADYVDAHGAIGDGMPPGGEAIVKLYMDTRDMKAVGYRLYVFYPDQSPVK
jgi:predicted Zn finger-like uncharacterized protein